MKHLLTDIPGIGESTVAKLGEHGIDSVTALLKGGEKKLCTVPGFGAARAAKVLAAAGSLSKGESAVEQASSRLKAEARKAVIATEKAAGQVKKGAKKAVKQAAKEAKKIAKAAVKVEKQVEKEAGKLAKAAQRKAKKVAKAAGKEAKKAAKAIKGKAKKK